MARLACFALPLLLSALSSCDAATLATPAPTATRMVPAPPSSASSSIGSEPFGPLCDQEQLIAVATMLSRLETKKQCQAEIGEEMFKTSDPLVVCRQPTCVAALRTMYRELPKCLFRKWDMQYHAEMLLRNCGIEPDGSDDGAKAIDKNCGGNDTQSSRVDNSTSGTIKRPSPASLTPQLVSPAPTKPSPAPTKPSPAPTKPSPAPTKPSSMRSRNA